MRGSEFLDKMNLINPAYIEAAGSVQRRRTSGLKKWCLAAACLCLAFCLAMPAAAASVPAVYEALYAVSPAAAQFFKPVQLSCEDNGIRMQVASAYIHGDTAEIYVSLQDLEGERIDETTDLFDSYDIRTPLDCEGACQLSDYDPDSRTATFFVCVTTMNGQNIQGDKLTFSVREFLSGKKTYQGILDGVNWDIIGQNAEVLTVDPQGCGGEKDFVEAYKNAKSAAVLKPTGTICSPVGGTALTGVGYVDGRLHVQMYYENIFETDNHGYVFLVNRETGERIDCTGSILFRDDTKKNRYEDYIFDGIPEDALGSYALHGNFVTAPGSIKGNWSVTFPLENTDLALA